VVVVGVRRYCLDSLQTRPSTIKPNKALATGLGHILIYAKSATAESQSKPSGAGKSKVSEGAAMENARAVRERKKRTKRASRDAPKPAPGRTKARIREELPRRDEATHAGVPGDAGSSPREEDDDNEAEDGQHAEELLTSTRNPFSCLRLDE
jgi:hypothetical protein